MSTIKRKATENSAGLEAGRTGDTGDKVSRMGLEFTREMESSAKESGQMVLEFAGFQKRKQPL